MTKIHPSEKEMIGANENSIAQLSRRKFLGYSATASGLIMVAAACKKKDRPKEYK